MKDYLGNDLSDGDIVVIMRPGYRDLCLAKVLGISPSGKTLYLQYKHHSGNYYNEVKQSGNQVIKYFGNVSSWEN